AGATAQTSLRLPPGQPNGNAPHAGSTQSYIRQAQARPPPATGLVWSTNTTSIRLFHSSNPRLNHAGNQTPQTARSKSTLPTKLSPHNHAQTRLAGNAPACPSP